MRVSRAVVPGVVTVLLVAGCSSQPGPARSSPTSSLPAASATATESATPSSTSSAVAVGRIVTTVHPGGFLDGLAYAGGVLWAVDVNGDRLTRVRVSDRAVLPAVPSPGGPISVVAAGGSIWVAHYNGTDVTRYDAVTGRRTASVTTPGGQPCGLAMVGGRLWVFDQTDGTAAVIDPSTAKVVARLTTPAMSGFVGVGFGAIWVPDFTGTTHAVDRVDLATRRVTAYPSGGAGLAAATGDGSVWVSDNSDGQVVRLDPATGKVVATIAVPSPSGILVQPDRVWVASYQTMLLTAIDPQSNTVLGSLPLPGPAQNIVAVGSDVWVSQSDGSLSEVARA